MTQAVRPAPRSRSRTAPGAATGSTAASTAASKAASKAVPKVASTIVPAAATERPVPAPRKGAARPEPVRNTDFAHLSLDALRQYRTAVSAEENKVSYWRRILQARLDVVEAGAGGAPLDQAHLRPVLTDARVGAGRQALAQVLQVDDIPPLPSLAELWDRRTSPQDAEGIALLATDLRAAEAQLSAYRTALHRMIGEATLELIARYREQPGLCLSALPLAPRARATA